MADEKISRVTRLMNMFDQVRGFEIGHMQNILRAYGRFHDSIRENFPPQHDICVQVRALHMMLLEHMQQLERHLEYKHPNTTELHEALALDMRMTQEALEAEDYDLDRRAELLNSAFCLRKEMEEYAGKNRWWIYDRMRSNFEFIVRHEKRNKPDLG